MKRKSEQHSHALTRGLACAYNVILTFFTVRNTDQASHITLSCNNWAEGSFGGRGFFLEMSLISTFLNIKPLHCAVGSPMNPSMGVLFVTIIDALKCTGQNSAKCYQPAKTFLLPQIHT